MEHAEFGAISVVVLLLLVNSIATIALLLVMYNLQADLKNACTEVKNLLVYIARRSRRVDLGQN
jgi:hypothetical protein